MCYVILEVEIFVINPVREIEFQRHMNKPSFEQRTHVQAPFHVRENVLEAHDFAPGD